MQPAVFPGFGDQFASQRSIRPPHSRLNWIDADWSKTRLTSCLQGFRHRLDLDPHCIVRVVPSRQPRQPMALQLFSEGIGIEPLQILPQACDNLLRRWLLPSWDLKFPNVNEEIR